MIGIFLLSVLLLLVVVLFLLLFLLYLNIPVPCLRISHIWVHKLYYESRALFYITNLQIYDKDKREQVRIMILYKHTMDSYTFLFYLVDPKIGRSQVVQAQVAYMYVQVVSE